MKRLHTCSKTVLAVACLLAVTGGCSPGMSDAPGQAAQVQATHAESGLSVIPLVVTSAKGAHRFRVELARSPFEQAKGLMFRTKMGANEGMLFPLDPPRPASFWMKNTFIPLDIIFIDSNRRILNVVANTVPYSEAPIKSAGDAAAVLELVGGRAARLGIAAGDRVEW